jgi:hypothetical protein
METANIYEILFNDFGKIFVTANSFEEAEKKFKNYWKQQHKDSKVWIKKIECIGQGIVNK